jgi:adenosylmethionine-8-amino-7-oxononanoate aminotransferase
MSDSPVWPPFTPLAWAADRLQVVRASGNKLTLHDGTIVIDAISSWWTNLHGHGHPALVKAIADQAAQLDHVIFAGFTHEPAEQLARFLADSAPRPGMRVFFSDNGSTAIEVALKLAVHAHLINGEQRNRIVAFEGAYHGDTVGAMSAGARGLFAEPYSDMLFEVDRFPFPETWIGDENVEEKEAGILDAVRVFFEEHGSETTALIIEPLVQGAGGMRMCRPEFVRGLMDLCKTFEIRTIFDEVMTGFGRTGTLFAWQKAGVSPDFIALSKGISGGMVPLGATLIAPEIAAAFDSEALNRTFFHGHSYAGNPIACAAGVVSWKLLQQAPAAIQSISSFQQQKAEAWAAAFPGAHARSCGTILAVEVDGRTNDYRKPVSRKLREHFLQRGLLLRPLGNTVYVLPPYCTTVDELEMISAEIERVIRGFAGF